MSRYTNTVPAIHDKNGLPIVGAKKFFFKPGTTIPKEIYKDPDFIIPQTNPVLSDSVGRFPDIFLDGVYKELQQDNSGTDTGFDGITLWTKDPVGDAPISGEFQPWNPLVKYVITSIVVGSDDNYYKSKTDPNLNNDPVSNPLSWTQLQFGEVWNSTTSYIIGNTVYGDDGFSYIAKLDNVGKEPSISSEWSPNTRHAQFAIAAGTSDAITAAFSPALTGLKDGQEVRVRALLSNTTATPTFSPNGLPAKTITKEGNNTLDVNDIRGLDHNLILSYNANNDVWELLNTNDGGLIGSTSAETSVFTQASEVISYNDTLPAITDGREILTVNYTPKRSSSKIEITVNCHVAGNTGLVVIAALFDGSANAIGAGATDVITAITSPISFSHLGSYPSGVPITFTVRVGISAAASVFTVNGASGGRRLGGSLSSTLIIKEVK